MSAQMAGIPKPSAEPGYVSFREFCAAQGMPVLTQSEWIYNGRPTGEQFQQGSRAADQARFERVVKESGWLA